MRSNRGACAGQLLALDARPVDAARTQARPDAHGASGQGIDEVQAVKAAYGYPSGVLDQGFLGPDLVGAHWTWCTPSNVELLASRGTQMAHCPADSTAATAYGADRVDLRCGRQYPIGTDNMTEDMFQALKIGMIVHRGGRGRETEGGVDPQPQAMLDAITRSAARSVGAQAEIGSIEVGKKADLTLLDLNGAVNAADHPAGCDVGALWTPGNCAFRHGGDGVFLMRDRKVLTLDEPALLREAQLATERVWQRMLARNPDIAPPAGGPPRRPISGNG